MTRVCVRCGWLVLEGERCVRDRGLSVEWGIAAKACRVRTLRELLHVEPTARVIGFIDARDRLLSTLELSRDVRPAELGAA